ncbi:hypothetical protein IA57_02045 [Mangrovimonas yunxiaonensis]|uniref:CUB domain-containing protein n=1 Tax=Mangrovimonas yunxiaonensis TaxID=1197477 RepID=A0A084TP01_9FLAO|nr:T9SS sorting signal type C domain-containing protein [Mangrovimonas yunxiaonensis]KFB02437.1 hypothetical protein IA57_02045 [Mangrovimonas yunxiaonensis]GGH40349.1 hypothetical protein GCM10011364_10380 [Mangrovimonas yunxiaonensis]
MLPPTNDDACGAVTLNASNGFCSSGTTQDATNSAYPTNSCTLPGDDDDVWFKFVTPGSTFDYSSFTIELTNITGTDIDLSYAVFRTSSGSCTSFSRIDCFETNRSTLTELYGGYTYYIQVYTTGTGVANYANFDLCVNIFTDPCGITNIPELVCGTLESFHDYNNSTSDNGFLNNSQNPCQGSSHSSFEGREMLYSFTPDTTGDYDIWLQTYTGEHIGFMYKEASLGCNDSNWNCIGHYFGGNQTGTITLTGGVTYYFLVDLENNNTNYSKAKFAINCPVSCDDSFFDPGGPNANYGLGNNKTTTICADSPGSPVTVTFNAFDITDDNLAVYDGSSTSATLIGTYTGTTIPGPFTSTDPSGCLTFVFTSGWSNTGSGWEAEVTCCIVWEGSANTDWNTATNWSSGTIPTIDDCIVIPDATTTPNDPILDYTDPNDRGAGLNLTVQNNAYLELNHDTELTIKEWVDVQGNAVFNIKNNASLIQIDETNLNAGSIHVQRAPNANFSGVSGLEYVYWSSPVSGFDITNVSPGTNTGLIFEWDPTVAGFGTGNHGYWYNASGAMVEGQGYIIRGLSGTPNSIANTLSWNPSIPVTANTALFSGAPHNGTLTVDVFHGGYDVAGDPGYQGNSSLGTLAYNDDDNWNLIGNPYPSAISADAFAAYNTNISGTVYLWQHAALPNQTTDPFYEDYTYNYDSSNYVEYNSSGSVPPGIDDLHIASGQGFFVTVNHSAPLSSSVTFTNSMRQYSSAYNNNTFFRVSDDNAIRATATESTNMSQPIERHRVWLNLSNSNNMANTLLIGYIEGATNEFDRLYDGIEVKSTDLSFYSINNDFKCSIQGRALPFNTDDAIPLGMYLPQNDTYSIAINTLDGLFTDSTQNIYLEDTYLNIVHNLKESPYNFTADMGALNDRFILRYNAFGALHTNDVMAVENVTIIAPNNQFIKVNSGTQPIKTVTVYDLLGRPLISKDQISSHSITINHSFSDGTYIVIAVLESGLKKTKKVVLKH